MPTIGQPAYGAIEDLYRACHLPAPMVIVARDTVHFARLVKAWGRNGLPGPLCLIGVLGAMLGSICLNLGLSSASEAKFWAFTSAELSLLTTTWFIGMARSERGIRESFWWALPRAGFAAAAAALALGLDVRGWREGLPVAGVAMALAASALVVMELLAPMRVRQVVCETAWTERGRVGVWTRLRGAAPIGPIVSNRLRAALAEMAPIAATDHAHVQEQMLSDPGRRVLWDALRTHWSRLQIRREAEPALGYASASHSSDPAAQVSVLSLSQVDPVLLPRLLQMAVRVDSVAAAVSMFDRVAVVLPLGSSPSLTIQQTGAATWRRSRRVPWITALHWLDEPSPTAGLIDVVPTDGLADWFLAQRLVKVPDPTQRTLALKALGVHRAVAALRLRPVHEDAYGQLFQIGPREAPSTFLFVQDRVVDPNGSALSHWISVPPHVATVHEAVAWTFGMTEAGYHPTHET